MGTARYSHGWNDAGASNESSGSPSAIMSTAEHAAASDWFAIQVYTGRERVSATHLRANGYEVFLPCWRVRRQWSDRVKVIDQALFAGYLFCRVRLDVTGKIVTAPGVIRIVGDGHRPLPVPLYEINPSQKR